MITTIERDKIHQVVDTLPDNALIELARFIRYLQFQVQVQVQYPEQFDVIKSPENPQQLGWPPNFFQETYGCFADEPLERP